LNRQFKKVALLLLCAALITGICGVALANQTVNVFVNSYPVESDQPAFCEEETGITYVPLRAVSEALNCQVNWDGQARVISIEKSGRVAKLKVDSSTVIVDGQEKLLSGPVYIIPTTNRSMVPVRFFADILDYEIKASASAGIGIFEPGNDNL